MVIAYTISSCVYIGARETKEIKALLEAGHSVIVFAWDRTGNSQEQCNIVFEKYKDTIELHFYHGELGKSFLEKIRARIMWCSWLKESLLGQKNIDIIHTCDFDTGYIVRKVARYKKIKYVYDIFDYYSDSHKMPNALSRFVERQEIKVIDDAYVTIICTEERREQIEKANPQKIVVVHNSPEVLSVNESQIEYDYVYCGGLYGERLLEEILDEYSKHSELHIAFAGMGEFSAEAEAIANIEEKFLYWGPVPYNKVLELESRSRVISAIYEPSIRNHRLCAPNKFYEALALGKPIIVCKGTGIDRIVEKHNIGIVINYSASEFYSALEYLKNHKELCMEMGKRSRDLYEKEYSWGKMKNRLLGIYDSLENKEEKNGRV